MTATIEVNGLRLYARHGVDRQETMVGNLFEVTVHLHYPVAAALLSDSIAATLNYASVVDIVTDVMRTPSALLEHVAGRIHAALTEAFPSIKGGMIRVAKITPPIPAELADVAVRLEW